jgi:hypothetical protein
MTQVDKSYVVFVVQQIIPAPPGWHAVHYEEGRHVLTPTPLFALVTERDSPVGARGTAYTPFERKYPADASREVVWVLLNPGGHFEVANEWLGYCGLAAPGVTAETFLCGWHPAAAPGQKGPRTALRPRSGAKEAS